MRQTIGAQLAAEAEEDQRESDIEPLMVEKSEREYERNLKMGRGKGTATF